MKVKDAAIQAFPFIEPNADDAIKAYHPGISLRDYFAAKAMPLALGAYTKSCGAINDWHDIGGSLSCVAADAYRFADAMMEARK